MKLRYVGAIMILIVVFGMSYLVLSFSFGEEKNWMFLVSILFSILLGYPIYEYLFAKERLNEMLCDMQRDCDKAERFVRKLNWKLKLGFFQDCLTEEDISAIIIYARLSGVPEKEVEPLVKYLGDLELKRFEIS